MDDNRRVFVLRNTLNTIMLETQEPIIKAMAESALCETYPDKEPVISNIHCQKHNWFGLENEKCPLCS